MVFYVCKKDYDGLAGKLPFSITSHYSFIFCCLWKKKLVKYVLSKTDVPFLTCKNIKVDFKVSRVAFGLVCYIKISTVSEMVINTPFALCKFLVLQTQNGKIRMSRMTFQRTFMTFKISMQYITRYFQTWNCVFAIFVFSLIGIISAYCGFFITLQCAVNIKTINKLHCILSTNMRLTIYIF